MSQNIEHVDVLFELGCEELPPMVLYTLAQSLYQSVVEQLQQAELKLDLEASTYFASPRRLTFVLKQLETQQADKSTQRLGPAVQAAFNADGEPTPAASGFARSVGMDVADLQRIETDKGERLGAVVTEQGQSIDTLLPVMLTQAFKQLPIPKPMRWADHEYAFIRPVHWLILMKNNTVIPCQFFGVDSDRFSRGHRFYSHGKIEIASVDSYESTLEKAYVIVDQRKREASIDSQAQEIANDLNGRVIIKPKLLQEVASITEYPQAIVGQFDESFLEVPTQALVSSMEKHQKYFSLEDKDGELLPRFIAVANIESKQPEEMIEGFERVIKPRLADAVFFWEKDKARPLQDNIPLLEKMVFEQSLGSIADKSKRCQNLLQWLSEYMSFEASDGARAAELMKTDLMSDMVGEFADLQGIMGGYYAAHQGESDAVSKAISEHYLPGFVGDQMPASALGQALSMADKMDTLCGIFAVGKKPSGSKDPFALRRAALSIIQILQNCGLPINYIDFIQQTLKQLPVAELDHQVIQLEVQSFFENRLKQFLRDQGVGYDVVEAVLAVNSAVIQDMDARIEALTAFKLSEQAPILVEANKRIINILKKSESTAASAVNEEMFSEAQETQLWQQMGLIQKDLQTLSEQADYKALLTQLVQLAAPVEAYFDQVMVNAEDTQVRANRHAMLKQLSGDLNRVAQIQLLVFSD
ncbi:glycine--tRNA ligase subunit beta [Marinicella sp. W31]|uniref:glycine--tRNA ligase subunit beta n=1 Tax=Marinicella sp. W31 TaxID=3023713 RepID=UPI003756D39C